MGMQEKSTGDVGASSGEKRSWGGIMDRQRGGEGGGGGGVAKVRFPAASVITSRSDSNTALCAELRKFQSEGKTTVHECRKLKGASYIVGSECAILCRTAKQLVTSVARADFENDVATISECYSEAHVFILTGPSKAGYDPLCADVERCNHTHSSLTPGNLHARAHSIESMTSEYRPFSVPLASLMKHLI